MTAPPKLYRVVMQHRADATRYFYAGRGRHGTGIETRWSEWPRDAKPLSEAVATQLAIELQASLFLDPNVAYTMEEMP